MNEYAQVSLNRRITTLRKKSYNRYLWFYYYHLVDTTAGELLVLKVSAAAVSASERIWFIRYIRYRKNYVIIIKTNILLPQI